jgi:hypothetical protein
VPETTTSVQHVETSWPKKKKKSMKRKHILWLSVCTVAKKPIKKIMRSMKGHASCDHSHASIANKLSSFKKQTNILTTVDPRPESVRLAIGIFVLRTGICMKEGMSAKSSFKKIK